MFVFEEFLAHGAVVEHCVHDGGEEGLVTALTSPPTVRTCRTVSHLVLTLAAEDRPQVNFTQSGTASDRFCCSGGAEGAGRGISSLLRPCRTYVKW